MTRRPLFIAAAALSLLCGAAQAMKVGDTAPDFTRTDVAGKQVQLSKYRGQLVLLNFWASWCAPCREEMPLFSKWQRELGPRGLQVIGISMDDDAAEMKKFLAEFPVTYPIVTGDAKFAEHFGGVLGVPLSYLIDARGRVVARYQGEVDLPKLEAKVKELLPPRR
ncbi:MAG TPA: TlpA disulfide reductase family protein [Steroidobacteraceae bacterium]|nr:TlpA disulfide reductase family protein [Steroidobacteraceae bacterium]